MILTGIWQNTSLVFITSYLLIFCWQLVHFSDWFIFYGVGCVLWSLGVVPQPLLQGTTNDISCISTRALLLHFTLTTHCSHILYFPKSPSILQYLNCILAFSHSKDRSREGNWTDGRDAVDSADAGFAVEWEEWEEEARWGCSGGGEEFKVRFLGLSR